MSGFEYSRFNSRLHRFVRFIGMLPPIEKPSEDRWKRARRRTEQTKLPKLATIGLRRKLSKDPIRNDVLVRNMQISSLNISGIGELKEENSNVDVKKTQRKRFSTSHAGDECKKMHFAAITVEKIIEERIERVKQNIQEKRRNVNVVEDLMRKLQYSGPDAESSFRQLIDKYARSCVELSSINCSLFLFKADNAKNIDEAYSYQNEMKRILSDIELEKHRIESLNRILESFEKTAT